MIGKILGWSCVVSSFVFALVWLVFIFGGFLPPAAAGPRFWVLLACLSPLFVSLLCGPPLLFLNPFE